MLRRSELLLQQTQRTGGSSSNDPSSPQHMTPDSIRSHMFHETYGIGGQRACSRSAGATDAKPRAHGWGVLRPDFNSSGRTSPVAYKDPEQGRACDLKRYRRRTAERLARGMCPRYGEAQPVADHSLCQCCGEKRRKAERARCAKARAAGILYGGRDAERCRRSASDRSKRRDRARREAGLCTRCGKQQPVKGGTVCEPCRVARRDREREQYATQRAARLCGRCGAPAPDGSARCERCGEIAAKRSRKKAKNARSRRRYVHRRVRGLCIDCAAPSQGAARCPECARRSYLRSDEHRGLPILPPRYTVIEIATGDDHGYLEQDLIPSEVPQQADSCGFSTDLLGINPDRHFPPRGLIRLSFAPGKVPGRIDGGALATRISSFSAGLARR